MIGPEDGRVGHLHGNDSRPTLSAIGPGKGKLGGGKKKQQQQQQQQENREHTRTSIKGRPKGNESASSFDRQLKIWGQLEKNEPFPKRERERERERENKKNTETELAQPSKFGQSDRRQRWKSLRPEDGETRQRDREGCRRRRREQNNENVQPKSQRRRPIYRAGPSLLFGFCFGLFWFVFCLLGPRQGRWYEHVTGCISGSYAPLDVLGPEPDPNLTRT